MDRLGLSGHVEVEAGGCEEEGALPNCYGSFVPHAPLLKDSEDLRAAGLQTLRMDGCTLRASLLEPLGKLFPNKAAQLRRIWEYS